ncbi:tetratricopeptide protein [Chondrocystis sp. NIES-4102]|nr:tetratricopeptide protein [Chondrocystis sp. NIES-4102]
MSHRSGQVKENNQQSNSDLFEVNQNLPKPEDEKIPSLSSLSDADYEFLFNQLLEGVSHGWHDHRIAKFFDQLGDRGKQEDWVAWLERLRVKVVTLPIKSQRSLGTMMMRLGDLTKAIPKVAQIGVCCDQIGRELLFGDSEDIIWEYAGPDLILESATNEIAIETEQELSQRLPIDFSDLAASPPSEQVIVDFVDTTPDNDPSPSELPLSPSSIEIKDTITTDTYVAESSEIITSSTSNNSTPPSEITTTESQLSELEVINLEQLASLIKQDPELTQQIAEKLNLSLPTVSDIAQKPIKQTAISQLAELEQSSIELIESWFNLGLKQVGAGEFEKAIASWEKALKINPNLSEAWHNRGSALGRLGKYEDAVNSFQNALVIDQDNYQAWNDRAHALYQLQNWTEAINSWNNAIKIMPGNNLFWYHRGCAFEQLENWSEAIASYEKSLEIKPDFHPARSRYINLVADNSRSN